ncbi:MAG: CotH kinase family protein [Spirochaetales bacterium]|nr:CotH kinase family protein [Spirochaetales bacterium]
MRKKLSFISIVTFLSLFQIFGSDVQNKHSNAKMSKIETIFDNTYLGKLTINVSIEEWNKLLANCRDESLRDEYVKVDAEWNNKCGTYTLPEIGMRVRGNSTYAAPEVDFVHNSKKPLYRRSHLKLNFNEFHKCNVEKVITGINLKSTRQDNSCLQEVYTYDLFHRFKVWNVPHASLVKIYMKIGNDKEIYWGLYKAIEEVNKDFLKSRKDYMSKDGYLWKCKGATLKIENIEKNFLPGYELKTHKKQYNTAKNQLLTFISKLNSTTDKDFPDWIASVTDMELLLKTIAVEIICCRWDESNNFYLYFTPEGKLYYIPHDVDYTLYRPGEWSHSDNPLNWKYNAAPFPLFKRILDVPQYRKQLSEYLCMLVTEENNLATKNASTLRINKWYNLIGSSMYTGKANLFPYPKNYQELSLFQKFKCRCQAKILTLKKIYHGVSGKNY